jgi:hypothetical protein
MSEEVFCYVDGNWAYFTTQPLSEQWGDDWDDVPYEHNAGTPYEYSLHDRSAGVVVPWEIVKVAWDGEFETPASGHLNSPWSVAQINAGASPWLCTSPFASSKAFVAISAGTTLSRFCELIRQGGGKVYVEKEEDR